jgi:molybdopterin converting factor small subunit
MMRIHVQYFAVFRDQVGRDEETVITGARDPAALYRELQAVHSLGMGADRLKIAVNDEFASWDRQLKDGDRIVFIPPVAGG